MQQFKPSRLRTQFDSRPVWNARDGGTRPDEHLYFRRFFELERPPERAPVLVTAATEYRLYVNGHLAGFGYAAAVTRELRRIREEPVRLGVDRDVSVVTSGEVERTTCSGPPSRQMDAQRLQKLGSCTIRFSTAENESALRVDTAHHGRDAVIVIDFGRMEIGALRPPSEAPSRTA